MKSKMPKVLHKVCGKPLSKWVIDASEAAGADKVCAVVGHKAETVKEVLGDVCEFALQAEQKGTGHAVMQAIDVIKNSKGVVVILNGDTPLITAETINKAFEYHKNNGNQATVITAILYLRPFAQRFSKQNRHYLLQFFRNLSHRQELRL